MNESNNEFYDKTSTQDDSFEQDMPRAKSDSLTQQSFFDRYIISDEVFAHGGQAFVTKGFDLQRQKYVAVKTYLKEEMGQL